MSWAHRVLSNAQHHPGGLGFCFSPALLLGYSPDKPNWFSQLTHYLVAKGFFSSFRETWLRLPTPKQQTDPGCARGLPALLSPSPPACAHPALFAFVGRSFPVPPLTAPLATLLVGSSRSPVDFLPFPVEPLGLTSLGEALGSTTSSAQQVLLFFLKEDLEGF